VNPVAATAELKRVIRMERGGGKEKGFERRRSAFSLEVRIKFILKSFSFSFLLPFLPSNKSPCSQLFLRPLALAAAMMDLTAAETRFLFSSSSSSSAGYGRGAGC
jgi:hypothetical protein